MVRFGGDVAGVRFVDAVGVLTGQPHVIGRVLV